MSRFKVVMTSQLYPSADIERRMLEEIGARLEIASGERSDIERLANRIWILKEGRFYWQGDLDSLKESIVRVHLRGAAPLPERIEIPNAVSVRRDGNHVVAVVRDWDDAAARDLERRIGMTPEVETLALEEIFLELHR